MEAMTVDAASVLQSMQAGGITRDAMALGVPGGLQDIFAALFAQLLGETGELESQNAGELIAGLLDNGSGKKQEDDPNLIAMQMMAQSLIAPQALDMPLMQQNAADLLNAVQAAGDTTVDAAALAQTLLEAAAPQQSERPEEKKDDAWDALLETLTAAWEHTDDAGETPLTTVTGNLTDQVRFQSALRSVRETLAEKPRTQETPALDVEALQQSVNSRQFLTESAAVKQETPDIRDVAEQLKTGILDNVRQGKNEFVVKLKPAGLGEITVKFTESKNEIALRIITSSTSVGRMIANDVATLQNALRPLRAEVQEIVTVPPSNQSYAAGTALANDQADRQFSWHNNESQNRNARARHDESAEEFDAALDEAAPVDTNVNLLI